MQKALPLFSHAFGAIVLVLLLSCSSFPIKPVTAQTQPKLRLTACLKSDNFSTNSVYHKNLVSLLFRLTTLSSTSRFSTFTAGDDGPDQVNGFFLCRPDLPLSVCSACVSSASQSLVERCTNKKNATNWYEECTVHYTNRSILSKEESKIKYCWNSSVSVSQPKTFPYLLNSTMEGLIAEASSPNNSLRFAKGKANYTAVETLYGLVICRPDITSQECGNCLTRALGLISSCTGGLSVWAMEFLPSCQLWYDTVPFFSPSPLSPLPLPLPPSPAALAPTLLPSNSPSLVHWSFAISYVLSISMFLMNLYY